MSEGNRKSVDIGGSLAYILVHWKAVLIAAVLCAVICGGYGYVKKHNTPVETEASIDEQVESLRGKLAEEDALYVEQIFRQNQLYYSELNYWNAYLEKSLLHKLNPSDYVERVVQYSVQSDTTAGILSFNSSLIGYEEYNTLARAYGAEAGTDTIKDLVIISDIGSDKNTSDGTQTAVTPAGGILVGEQVEENEPDGTHLYQGVFAVTLIAPDETKASAMEAAMDGIITAKTAQLSENGVEVYSEKVSSSTMKNDARYLLSLQQSAISPLISLQSNRSSFVKNTVDTLDEENRGYYDLLVKAQQTEDTAAADAPKAVKKISVKKYAAAGGALGLILSVIALFLLFVCRDIIRTESEITDNFRIPVLQSLQIARKRNKADVIKNLGVRLLLGDKTKKLSGDTLRALEAEICRRMEGFGAGVLYIANESGSKEIAKAIEALSTSLKGRGMQVAYGNPVADSADYRVLLDTDAVLCVEELNKASKRSLKELTDVCRRNEMPVIGCAVFADTGNY